MPTFIVIAVLILLTGEHASCNKTDSANEEILEISIDTSGSGVYFMPKQLLKIKERTVHEVEWFTTLPGAHHASYVVEDEDVAFIEPFEEEFDPAILEGNKTGRGYFNVTAVFLGLNELNITIYDKDNNTLGWNSMDITVILSYDKINRIFTIALTVLLFTQYINMGATIDLQIVKGIVKKPIGPVVGIFCQYVLMPLFAFGLAKFVFADSELRQLGMFLNGASPGGGSSNMWTLLLGGSLDLSIMMTFASTLVAFGTIPMWVLTLGPKIIGEDSKFQIPYDSIAYSVISLIIPCSVGLLIQKFLPKVAKFLEKYVLKGMALFNLIFIASFGIFLYLASILVVGMISVLTSQLQYLFLVVLFS
ncbi:Ileal sodium/bile acid cotransporter [Armadillidium nasatum]|uniref:Ileal sodium/bile acid cotransporter n=1 Tax=Armadillidium nasatum TaxID=96803 RepID=A0A5N5TIH9_9CRUS|nr:Ileal sodium/bile acid cotransporter [Armadillidium nasatum]